MIVLHLTWLLNSLHLATSYRHLPKNELPSYNTYGAKFAQQRYRANLQDIPFHALVVYNGLYCSGALVRSKIVITSASCFVTDGIRRPVVKVGSETITGLGQIISVVEIKIHEYYKYMSQIDNDIALLVLKDHVKFDMYVKKAIIVDPEVALRTGVSIEVSGYGNTNLGQNYVNQLIWAEMMVMDKDECAATHGPLLTPSNYCAKYVPERRLSDSGGPAVYNKELLVGILSYGGTSEEAPHVAIFTNISYFHRWILLNTKRYLEKYCLPNSDSSDSDDEARDDSAS
ncbi:hypothetical protein PYW07_001235 [Mythimna separata]|uniref:Peptidase S1 domain-containing protein n=1 Tax=Mythimna separata TaxID=271217 RepID=A0AAD8DWL0_MYTSE|nr:hypothetical protein PYW07_001235 [Mythimna separata]